MLRIETESDGFATTLLLSGRIQADGLACIRSAMNGSCARKIIDLNDVTLVDIAAVRFLLGCQDAGIELTRCPPYVREWLLRERAAEAMDYGRLLSDNIIRTSRK